METPQTPTTDSLKSPIDNLLNILSSLSSGHEKALKHGIYNAVALFLLCLVLSAGYGLYIVLSPFLKPLVWALLCGAVLFPFKVSLSTLVEAWFDAAESSHTPFLLSLSMVPVSIFDKSSEIVGSFLQKYIRYVISFICAIFGFLTIYRYTPKILVSVILKLFSLNNKLLSFFIGLCNAYTVTLILVGYFSVLYLYWSPETSNRYRFRSFGIWVVISLYISNALSAYPIFVFLGLQILYLIGFLYEVALILEQWDLEGKEATLIDVFKYALLKNDANPSNLDKMPPLFEEESSSISIKSSQIVPKESDSKPPKPMLKVTGRSLSMNFEMGKSMGDQISSSRSRSACSISSGRMSITDHYLLSKIRSELRMSLDLEDDIVDTDKYMYGAVYACIGMIFWKNLWILYLLTIPVLYYFIKQLNLYFGFWKMLELQFNKLTLSIKHWCEERHEALFPIHIRGLCKVAVILDNQITKMLKGSIDAVTTTAVILILVVFVICTSIFITIQLYAEGIHLIQVGGEILNATLISNRDIDWVPKEWEDSVSSILDNAYMYGRSAISDGIRKLVKDLEPVKAEQLEKKVLELWDRLYQAWMMSSSSPNMIGPSVDVNAAFSVWESIQDSFGKSVFQFFKMSSIQNFVQENIGILMSVLDSLWSIVKGNISVVLSIITELLYIVLMSGSAVLSFTLSMVVFFTALFYLLSSSGKTYKPIEIITTFSPIGCHRFALALQESVIGVFTATFKLASFFGMWTWFTHNLFQVKIVYLPSVLATLLGAVPFLDAYFACIPATMELWFTQGPFMALIFFLFHFLPCNIIVTEFYKEIKGGGHPYLTGLSIAGGVFCLGIEGAIFGPLLLCCIMVAINLSRRYLQGPEEAINTLKSQIGKLES